MILTATDNVLTPKVSVTDNNQSIKLNLQNQTGGSTGVRAFVTPTEDGATITLIDSKGTTTVEIKNGRSELNDNDYEIIAMTVQGLLEKDKAVMITTTYDSNQNGIVDNAEKINGYSVESNVPIDAVFTDTQYTSLTSSMIDDICTM